jgi:hypothetical protein
LFGRLSRYLPNGTFRYVKQEFLQPQRRLHVRTRSRSLHHLPPWISLQNVAYLMTLHYIPHRAVTVYPVI